MALSGLQIQKLLPKTNCKDCGSNTCLAFAMKLAAKKADLSECPHASDEAKQVLGAASEPPVKPLAFGPKQDFKAGDETVLYRHEKTFVNRTLFAVKLDAAADAGENKKLLTQIKDYVLERVGEELIVEMVCVTGDDAAALTDLAKKAWEVTGRPLFIKSNNMAAVKQAAEAVKDCKGILSVPVAQAKEMSAFCKENGFAMSVSADSLDEIIRTTVAVKDGGFNDMLLELPSLSLAERFQLNAIVRTSAIKDSNKALGYPIVNFIDAADPMDACVQVVTDTSKYSSVCVLPSFDPAQLSPLMSLRQNIYTDPQKPIQVEPGIYPIGEPTPDSPVFVTTNFSLTYFIVSGEIENGGANAWLLIPECEGMSVLTAWAAGKFSGDSIGKSAKELGLEEKVKGRDIIIPGYVAGISGELEEAMPGWKVMVGPQEAADLESFINQRLK